MCALLLSSILHGSVVSAVKWPHVEFVGVTVLKRGLYFECEVAGRENGDKISGHQMIE